MTFNPTLSAWALAAAALLPATGWSQKAYDPGASDTEIRIGQTAPFSGPASVYGTVSRATGAFFAQVNDAGGVNRRKLVLLAEDDSFSPPKTVEQVRKLVERDNVLFIYQTIGTATNSAIQRYLNQNKVPQLLISTGAAKWNNPAQFAWTIPSYPNNRTEARIYGKYIAANKPDAKIGILYQNDDFGKDYLEGLREGLGDKADKMLVARQSYELTDPTVDSQVIALQNSGADTVMIAAFAKQAVQTFRKIGSMGWKPAMFVTWASASVSTVLTPAGFENVTGLISSSVLKDPSDPRWQNDADVKAYKEFMAKYYPKGDADDIGNIWPYANGHVLVKILEKAGDTLTRENVLKAATGIGELKPPMFLPGISFQITPTDYDVIKGMQLQRFDGKRWVALGDPVRN